MLEKAKIINGTQKVLIIKEKTDTWYYIKVSIICLWKENIKSEKASHRMWEAICNTYIWQMTHIQNKLFKNLMNKTFNSKGKKKKKSKQALHEREYPNGH